MNFSFIRCNCSYQSSNFNWKNMKYLCTTMSRVPRQFSPSRSDNQPDWYRLTDGRTKIISDLWAVRLIVFTVISRLMPFYFEKKSVVSWLISQTDKFKRTWRFLHTGFHVKNLYIYLFLVHDEAGDMKSSWYWFWCHDITLS